MSTKRICIILMVDQIKFLKTCGQSRGSGLSQEIRNAIDDYRLKLMKKAERDEK